MIRAEISLTGEMTLIPTDDGGTSAFALQQWAEGKRCIRVLGDPLMMCVTIKENYVDAKGVTDTPTTETTNILEHPKDCACDKCEASKSSTEAAEETPEEYRERLKAELDKMGITYAPKARTKTLETLYADNVIIEEKKKSDQVSDQVKEASASGAIDFNTLQALARSYVTDDGNANGAERDKRTAVLGKLLKKFNVARLSEIPEDKRAELAEEIKNV